MSMVEGPENAAARERTVQVEIEALRDQVGELGVAVSNCERHLFPPSPTAVDPQAELRKDQDVSRDSVEDLMQQLAVERQRLVAYNERVMRCVEVVSRLGANGR